MPGIDFNTPWYALLFAVIPAIFLLSFWLRYRGRREAAIRFSNLRQFRGLSPTPRLLFRWVVPFLRALALAILVLALMRPQRGTEIAPESSRGISILMAVDRSGSMRAEDFKIRGMTVNRLDAVKEVFKKFVKGGGGLPGRPNDEIGIISFAGYPVPVAPLTLDHGAVLEVLKRIKIYEPPQDSRGRPTVDRETLEEETKTAIGDALAMAVDRLKDLKSKSKVIILLSDGRQTAGNIQPEEGADLAKALGIKIYTIGIGQAGVYMETVNTFFGPRQVPRQSDLDEETLKLVAEKTGGKYFNAASTDALEKVYREIDQMERTEIKSNRFYRFNEKFQWLAVPALAILLLEVLLGQTIFRRIP